MTTEPMTTTRRAAAAIRKAGLTCVTGTPRASDRSEAWVIGTDGYAVVINCQTHARMGFGCYGKPGYHEEKAKLTEEVMAALKAAGIAFRRSPTPDQLFLSGYQL